MPSRKGTGDPLVDPQLCQGSWLTQCTAGQQPGKPQGAQHPAYVASGGSGIRVLVPTRSYVTPNTWVEGSRPAMGRTC